jgi:Tfp pilus assembly protein PilF
MKSTPFLLAPFFILVACSSSPPPKAEDPSPDQASSPTAVAEPSNEIVQQGILALQEEKWEQARNILFDARRKDPKDPQAAYYLAVAWHKLNHLELAEKNYKAALELDPKLAEAAVNLSQMYLDQGKDKEALAVLDTALKSNPKQPDLLLNRAVALEKSGSKEEVLSAYGAAVQARPGDPMLHAVYGGLLSEAGKGPEAVVELKAAIAAEDPALLVSIATVLTKENAFDECIQAVDKALSHKKAPAVLVRRGICKDGKKDDKGAAADYDAALAMDANFAPAHYYYGLSLASKDKQKALEHLDKAAATAGDKGIGPDAKKKAAELRGGGAAPAPKEAPKKEAAKPKK